MSEPMNRTGGSIEQSHRALRLPELQQNTVLREGFWADEKLASELWADCLVSGGQDRFIKKLADVTTLFGYRAHENPWSVANVAWFNGAVAFEGGMPLEAVLQTAGPQEEAGHKLLAAVFQVRGVAGHEGGPLADQRKLLSVAFERGGFGSVAFLDWLEICAVGGWLAAEADHLVTHRGVKSGVDWLLTGQLLRVGAKQPEGRMEEALARMFAAHYGREKPLEAEAVGQASGRSLAAARAEGWGVCGFLLDGIRRGEEWVRQEPSEVLGVLKELGFRLTAQEQVVECLHDGNIGRATDAMCWRKDVVQWTPFQVGELGQRVDRGSALRVLRHAYDGTFWFGATREMNRSGTTQQWMARRERKPVIQETMIPGETLDAFKTRIMTGLKSKGCLADNQGHNAGKKPETEKGDQ